MRDDGPGRLEPAAALPGARRAGALQPGRHLLGLLRSARHREDLPLLPGAARRRRRRLGARRARPRAARRARSRCSSTTSTASSASCATASCPPSWCSARSIYLPQLRGVRPPGGVRIHIAGIDLIRNPDGALPRARGQPAHALGRLLRGREPPGHQARLPARRSTRRACAASTTTRRELAETLRSVSPAEDAETRTVVVLTPGPVQLGLLRAQLPGAHDGPRAGPGGRPLRRAATTVFVRTTRGPAPRRTSSTAASTTPSSIPSSSAPTACSACPG